MWFGGLRSQYGKKLRELQDKHFSEVTGLNEMNHKLRMEVEDLKAKHSRDITTLKHEIGLAKEKFQVEVNAQKDTAELEAKELKLHAQEEIIKAKDEARKEILAQIKSALETKAGSATELLNIILQKVPNYRASREEKVGNRPDMLIEHNIGRKKKKK